MQHLRVLVLIAAFSASVLADGNYFSNSSVNPLAVGGNYINRGECPWLCAIFVETSFSEPKYLCSSSLITNKFVLTAAHCVQPKKYRNPQYFPHEYLIYVGKHDLKNKHNEPKSKIIHGTNIEIHPAWNFTSDRYDGDIALIEMQQGVQFLENFIERIVLPIPEMQASPGKNGFVVGYGRSETEIHHENIPRRIEIPVIDHYTCYESHHHIGSIKSRDAFCAGKQGVVPCNGDSGGSFYVNDNRKAVILGVVSVGIAGHTEKPCNDEVYALFTDIVKYVDWLKRTVGGRGFLEARKRQIDDEEKETNPMENRNMMWKDGSGFCEYVVDDGYRCTLRGIHSTDSKFRVFDVSGNHESENDDGDVTKLWVIEQKTTFIPEFSMILKKFTRVRDFRIWSSQLKFIERSKLKPFKKLRVLDFFNNLIEEIPEDAFDDLSQLEELIILKNRIKKLSQNLLKNLHNLKWFRAKENEIETLPANFFDGTQEIVEVQMSENNLKKVFVDFNSLRNVNVIDFNNNDCISKCLGHYCERISVNDMQKEIEAKCG